MSGDAVEAAIEIGCPWNASVEMTSEKRLKRVEIARWIVGGRAIPPGTVSSANALRCPQAWHVLGMELVWLELKGRESQIKVGGSRARSGGLVQKHRSQMTGTRTRVERQGHRQWLDYGHTGRIF